jgi:CRISPR-associated endonuclease/helicase Cas3
LSILANWASMRRRLASALALDDDVAAKMAIRLLALHDLGKFAASFQAKSPENFSAEFGRIERFLAEYDHASGGYLMFKTDEALQVGLPGFAVVAPLAAASMGHHGAPPRRMEEDAIRRMVTSHGLEAARTFAAAIDSLLPLPDIVIDPKRARRASLGLAGFAVLCDWIGSNEDWFPYECPSSFAGLGAYWEHTCKRAEAAVMAAAVLPARSAPSRGFGPLTGLKFPPSPLQAWAVDTPLPPGPSLAILEDETGSGKTEAAIMLAHRLIAAGRADGLYLALPTMATANAMFARLSAIYRRLFDEGEAPSIVLAHGRRDLVMGFRDARLAGGRAGDRYGPDPDDQTASAACAEWIADDRRRAFLADIGVGTIDQAALAILPSRFQSLRLFGLSNHVLIVDEIHAYDDYVRQLIEGLLEFHAANGGAAILLSATLPADLRAGFVRAFAKGAGAAGDDNPATEYPRATLWTPDGAIITALASRPGRARDLPVTFLSSPMQAEDAIAAAAERGEAALYLRNSVGDAKDSFERLRGLGFAPILFHSQFALIDRLAIEQQVLGLFGPASTPETRRSRILVATQVAEQSLDLDFDCLATDLAPIDLVIQRAGRLWRHARPERTGTPELLMVSPEPVDDATANWYARLFPRAAHVYRHHGRLWLTARILARVGAIRSPGGLRELVEAVYGDSEPLPPGLENASWVAEGKEGAAASFGKQNVLKLIRGYTRDGGLWDVEERTPTRLVDQEQSTLRLARLENDVIVPWAPIDDGDLNRAWRLSEVNVARSRIAGEAPQPGLDFAVVAAKAGWTRYDDDKILVVLRRDGDWWHGDAADLAGGTQRLQYSVSAGLRVESQERHH